MGNVAEINPLSGQLRDNPPVKVVPIDHYRSRTQGKSDLFSLEERLTYLRQYGNHCMSFSTLQPGMHFFDVPGIGFIAYMQKWGNRLTLADPVCDIKDREVFFRELLKDGKHTTFVQISQDTAELLHDKFGYYATQFGIEINLDLKRWDLKGKEKADLEDIG